MPRDRERLDNEPVIIAGSHLPPPTISYLPDRREWRLEAEYAYRHDGHQISIPTGFEFDLSSVPRVFWPLIAPFELSIVAPLFHDFIYGYGGELPVGSVVPHRTFTRRQTDDLFHRLMVEEGVVKWRRFLGYRAVVLFGSFAWREPL